MQTVIFDMDGVIINSERMHFKALQKTLSEQGVLIGFPYYSQFIGSTVTHMWDVLERKFHFTKPRAELNAAYEMNKWFFIQKDGYQPVDGAQELVQRLFRSGVRLAVASSSSPKVITDAVNALHIRNCFLKLISGETVTHPKPAPDIFLKTARQLDVEPTECIVIEDSTNGVRAAKAAGMYCIGLQNPDSGNQDLSQADLIVTSLRCLSI